MAACAAVQEAVHLRGLLSNLGENLSKATPIFEDNQGAIALAYNPVFHKRSKHIDVRFHFVRERVASGEVELLYVPTAAQLADLLTKPLPAPRIAALTLAVLGQAE